MKKISNLILIPLFLACVSTYGQRDFSDVEVKATLVSKSIYMLEGSGGNIGVCVGEDGIMIVDDQFAGLAPKIDAALAELNPGSVKYVLNTHLHGDHTGGNQHFGEKHATIVAHDHVRERLLTNEEFAAVGLPVITFSETATIHFNGETIELLYHGPGHTDGDSIVKFKNANVIHMGDLMFNGRFPYIDLGSGGDVAGYIVAVENALTHTDVQTKIIPGHGALGTRLDLEKSVQMIRETSAIVHERIKKGMTLDQIKEAGLPDKWESFGEGWIKQDRWIETLYNDAKN